MWATPIVPVLKDDGTVRICRDYKQTINQAPLYDKYPVLKTEDLFATLNDGEKFCKLDLSCYYHLSPMLIWVYFNQKEFDIHSASRIFQRGMEKCLDKILFIKLQSDISISGTNYVEHLKSIRNQYCQY